MVDLREFQLERTCRIASCSSLRHLQTYYGTIRKFLSKFDECTICAICSTLRTSYLVTPPWQESLLQGNLLRCGKSKHASLTFFRERQHVLVRDFQKSRSSTRCFNAKPIGIKNSVMRFNCEWGNVTVSHVPVPEVHVLHHPQLAFEGRTLRS